MQHPFSQEWGDPKEGGDLNKWSATTVDPKSPRFLRRITRDTSEISTMIIVLSQKSMVIRR